MHTEAQVEVELVGERVDQEHVTGGGRLGHPFMILGVPWGGHTQIYVVRAAFQRALVSS
jgi:hypothetical protein